MKNEVKVIEIDDPDINIDLINDGNVVSPASKEGKEFSEFMTGVFNKMLDNNPEQKKLLEGYSFNFCLRDTDDDSSARITDADYTRDNTSFSGDRFVLGFSVMLLSKFESEDEIAHVMGHELSHVLYNKHPDLFRDLHENEEVFCDLNSLKMLKNAGYKLDAAEVSLLQHSLASKEMRTRLEECRKFAMQNFSDVSYTPYDGKRFKDAKFVPSTLKYNMPEIDDSEEAQQDKIIENLKMVYKYGDRAGFSKKMKGFVEELGSEKASKLIINTTARVAKEFRAIDEIKEGSCYREHLRHPMAVMSDTVGVVSRMEGKKLYPPKPLAEVNKYIKDNPSYFKGMGFVWNGLFNPKPPHEAGDKDR